MEKHKALNSEYIIDGTRLESTPAELLDECLEEVSPRRRKDCPKAGDIADESLDKPLKTTIFRKEEIDRYAELATGGGERAFELAYPEQFTRQRIAKALLDTIWKAGHFTLGDLSLRLDWKWNSGKLGAMAAFRLSASAAADYIFELDSAISSYSFEDGCGDCSLEVGVEGCDIDDSCLHDIDEGDTDDWIIYIPFDTCPHRLGASVLARQLGSNGDTAPEINDPDWFMDCYEVVRELVEDGIVTGGATVCDGGLMAALKHCFSDAQVNISGISQSYGEKDSIRILFGEVPGVLIRIRDVDYDYVDSQMLLQDIAYYPLGHPSAPGSGLSITDHSKPAISSILDSLLNVATEGED
ncbi:MAG: hypothetical protein MJZ07_01915 [Bacteroidales bacterium]|nr:hypothetical protein [Bacteroidales bacterium]